MECESLGSGASGYKPESHCISCDFYGNGQQEDKKNLPHVKKVQWQAFISEKS